jgi:hypothetical protein
LLLVERNEHSALRIQALADFVAQVAFDQRLVATEEKVVGLRPIDAADLVDIAEALRGEERTACSRPLQNGVDRNGRTMKEKPRSGKLRPGLRHSGLDTRDEPRRSRERLSEAKLPGGLVEGGHVRERSAHVGRQPKST